MPIQSLNPATGKLLRSFEPLTPEALNAKLAIAASAARTYPAETLDQRIFWMRRLAALLDADREELAATMTTEMGKTLASALPAVTTPRTPRAYSRPSPSTPRARRAMSAMTQSASCSPSCRGTSLSGRSSASSPPR